MARAWQIHTQCMSRSQHCGVCVRLRAAALAGAWHENKQQPLGTPVSSPFTPAPLGDQSIQLIDNKSMNRCRVVTDIPPTPAAAAATRNNNEPFNQQDG